ncbi:MAG: cytochrome P450 [Sulfobacillus acidophilus]|uniref:Cytochrome P450 n=1 Tax=Sulfobacillus acidophilus TaxID=53633 RepID=A0A2T2WNV8_9FIRM|nr:MAG: cytochrome P450 [Sulfobacillus acidophilus]
MVVSDARALSTSEGLENPYAIYHNWRQEDTVLRLEDGDQQGAWYVTSYDGCEAILKDAPIWKDVNRMGYHHEGLFGRTMLFQDPPHHTRLRGLVNRAFTPTMVKQLEPGITDIVDWLLDQIVAEESVDFMAALAMPLPVIVIAEILGIPSDREHFRVWSQSIIADPLLDRDTAEPSLDAMGSIAEYFNTLILKRRHSPSNDLPSALIAVEEDGERLSHAELLGMCVLLLIAGHETTTNLLGNGWHALLEHRASSSVCAPMQNSCRPPAVEEMLRYDSPVQMATYRMDFGGHRSQPGESVVAVLGAANRDGDQFLHPDQFDVARTPNRHLAFGRGIHFCLGAPVARLEGLVVFSRILQRFSGVMGGPASEAT